jgi:transcriptional regulator with XRE-family HTH domain
MTQNHLPESLRRLREAKGWQQWRLARESGVSQPMVCALERGIRGGSAKSIGKLAAALGADVSALMLPRTCGTCAGTPPRGFICQSCGSAGGPAGGES